jgi:hypothetical protein
MDDKDDGLRTEDILLYWTMGWNGIRIERDEQEQSHQLVVR